MVMQTCVSPSPLFHVHISDTSINIIVRHIHVKNTQMVIILWYFFPIQPYYLFYEHYTLSKRNLIFNKMCFLFLRTNRKHLKQAWTHLNNDVIQLCQSGGMMLFKYKNNKTLRCWKQHMNFWKLNTKKLMHWNTNALVEKLCKILFIFTFFYINIVTIHFISSNLVFLLDLPQLLSMTL